MGNGVNKVILIGNVGDTKWQGKFWDKVARGDKAQCWIWTGAKKPTGYGNLRINKAYKSAHRTAWEIVYGEIPARMHVMHACDNPACCNPNHLMLGTIMSNRIDMVRKGRANYRHSNRLYGKRNPNGKLDSEQVAKIRALYIPGVTRQTDIAIQFAVSQRLISLIVRGEVRKNG